MYERFTDRARKVMQLANQDAQRFRREYIGTEHILLGLIAEGSGVAANVLKALDVDVRKARREVERIVQHGPGGAQVVMGRLPPTPRAQKVVDYAIEESRNLNHNYVGTEHLLLGLLREQEGVAAQVLMDLGLRLEDTRGEVLNFLGRGLPDARTAPAPPAAPRPPSRVELSLIRDLVRRLDEQKEAFVAGQQFEAAAHCREQAEALKALLAWYDRSRG